MMLNPSDAGAEKNDPTMLRVIKFSQSWGYDGCIVVNLYPYISSDPREMWKWSRWLDNGPDWYARDDMMQNLIEIGAAGRMSCLRVLAFGAQPALRDQAWIEQCLERFEQDGSCACLGRTATGQPIHPLARGKHRVSDAAQPIVWR